MLKEVNIFKAGLQTAESGMSREFTVSELDEIVNSYDPDTHEAPIRIGHEDNDKVPAWGWVKGLMRKGEDLYAKVDFSPLAKDFIKNGLYKKVSASFYSPASKINPHPGKWSLRHIALLGAQPPAVKGLKGFAYEEPKTECWSFSSDLSPESVYDVELGPTLKQSLSPLQMLKEKIDMAKENLETTNMGEKTVEDVEMKDKKEKEMETEMGMEESKSQKKETSMEESVIVKVSKEDEDKGDEEVGGQPETEEEEEEEEDEEMEMKEKPSMSKKDLEKEVDKEVSKLLKELDIDIEEMAEELVEEVELADLTKEKEKKINSYSEMGNPELDKVLARIRELEEANSRLKADVEFAERKAFRTSLQRFTDTLYDSGKLTESVIKQEELIDYMEGLEYGTYQFSEGESIITPLVNLLNRLPQMVSYGEFAPETEKFIPEPVDPHEKALAISREEGVSYSEALKKALFG